LVGAREESCLTVAFDTLGYLTQYPDVAAANVNPLDHFLLVGIYERRLAVTDGAFG
jgi:serralysin